MDWLRRYERFWLNSLDRLAPMPKARKPKRGRRDDDQSNARAPDQGAASIVFDALTTPEGIASWWGPDGGPVLAAEIDPQVGGRFRVRFRTLDGSEHESSGEYLEVVKPERLSMTWRWTGGVEIPASRLSKSGFAPSPMGPSSPFTHSRLHDEETRHSHEDGWTGALDKLERHFRQSSGALRDQASAAEPRRDSHAVG